MAGTRFGSVIRRWQTRTRKSHTHQQLHYAKDLHVDDLYALYYPESGKPVLPSVGKTGLSSKD